MVNGSKRRPDLLELRVWAVDLEGYFVWLSRHKTVLGDRFSIHGKTSHSDSASDCRSPLQLSELLRNENVAFSERESTSMTYRVS